MTYYSSVLIILSLCALIYVHIILDSQYPKWHYSVTKDLLTANLSLETLKSDDRYSFYDTYTDYGGVKQKWVLLLSHKMKEKKEKTLRNKYDKEIEKARKSLKKLMGRDFYCEEDALKAAEIWIQDFPYVEFEKIKLSEAAF